MTVLEQMADLAFRCCRARTSREQWPDQEWTGSVLTRSMEMWMVLYAAYQDPMPEIDHNADGQMHEAVAAIAACGVSPVVRIAANESLMVKRTSASSKMNSITC